MNKTAEFSTHFKLILHVVNLYEEGYNLFGIRISIMNHLNSYVDIVLFFLPALKGNQIMKGITQSIKLPCFAVRTQFYQCVLFKQIKKPRLCSVSSGIEYLGSG